LKEHDCVRVAELLRKNRRFDGTEIVKRAPQISDVGTIVHFNESFCIVENVDADGYTVWLADFLIEEVEIYE
jgi:hypothetical protein